MSFGALNKESVQGRWLIGALKKEYVQGRRLKRTQRIPTKNGEMENLKNTKNPFGIISRKLLIFFISKIFYYSSIKNIINDF